MFLRVVDSTAAMKVSRATGKAQASNGLGIALGADTCLKQIQKEVF